MKSTTRTLLALTLCCSFLLTLAMPIDNASAEAKTFKGVGPGRNGEIIVNVTFAGDKMTDIAILSHSETPGISDPAFEQLPKRILEGNSVTVDTIAGATVTCEGIIKAVTDALVQAGLMNLEEKSVGTGTRNSGTKADYADILSHLMGNEKAIAPNEYYEGLAWIGGMFDHWEKIAEENAPEIRTLKNGVKVQRTPSEYGVYAWQISGKNISYNTYFLNADQRGCGTCHYDLNETLREMKFAHPAVWNDALGNVGTVETCLFCHTETHGYCISDYDFGTFIHGMHYGKYAGKGFAAANGNCMTCHNMTADGKGIALWDVVKYEKMVGILDIPNVQGEFAYNQDLKQKQSELFTYDWLHSYYDALRRGTGVNGSGVNAYPQRLFDEWTITVEGNVKTPYTAFLKDLVRDAEAEGVVTTKLSKKHCTWNAVGGGGIGQVEITGIPVAWLLEKAGGYLPDSTGVNCKRADGGDPERSWALEHLPNAYLVYMINGEPLDATHGAPCSNWVEGVDAQSSSMTPDRYVVRSKADNFNYSGGAGTPNGWFDAKGEYTNNPNATILGVPEGLIIETGKPYTFNGYADAFNETIASIEFSFDQGATWTKYDIQDTDARLMLTWTYTFTPEMDGSYVMMIRATSETGRVSSSYHKAMFTSRSDVDELK